MDKKKIWSLKGYEIDVINPIINRISLKWEARHFHKFCEHGKACSQFPFAKIEAKIFKVSSEVTRVQVSHYTLRMRFVQTLCRCIILYTINKKNYSN